MQSAPPSEDKRFRIVMATMRKHGFASSALIETLHSAQEVFGYLDDITLHHIAENLSTPLSRVYGVATFYNLFMLKPQGLHTCVVCLGTACYIKGAPQLLTAVETAAGIHKGETTPDEQVSLLVAHCLGTCGLAPVAVFDGEVSGNVTPTEASAQIRKWVTHEP